MGKRNWNELLQLLDVRQPVPKASKSEGAIEFWRRWDPERACAVWGKLYRSNGNCDLSAFNDAEIEWLRALRRSNVPGTYRAARIEHVGTKLLAPAQTTIETLDCGPTLDDWLTTTVHFQGQWQSHILVQREAFLTLALRLLEVLQQVHKVNFVHCDIHTGNLTIPVHYERLDTGRVRLILRWEDLTLIDFGYAVNTLKTPLTTLPLDFKKEDMRVSPHLQRILATVETDAMKLLRPGEDWANVWLDPAWWQCLTANPLNTFTQLDWREDLYQLGRMLSDIRDGCGTADHLEGCTLRKSPVESVNQLVASLPEELIALGAAQNLPPASEKPHRRLIESIQRVLNDARARGQTCPTQFEIHAADFEDTPVNTPEPVSWQTHIEQWHGQKSEQAPPRPKPAWAQQTGPAATMPLPPMVALRTASPIGTQFVVASTPVTWRQWHAACKHNPELFRPAELPRSGELPAALADSAVTGVSYLDCLAFLDTVNHLTGAYALEPLAHYRLPTASEWSLMASTGADWPHGALADAAALTTLPVSKWAPNAHGIAGLRGHLWQWAAAAPDAAWAPVRGGCIAQSAKAPADQEGPIDQYPTDWRSPYITLRLVRTEPTHEKSTRR